MAKDHRWTRRDFNRGVALVAIGGLAMSGVVTPLSRPVLALDQFDWTVNGDDISTDSGGLSGLTFGDADGTNTDEIRVSYEGLNDPPTTIEFELSLRGTDAGDGGWAGGSDVTGWEPLANGSIDVDQTNGTETYVWVDIFGERTPVDVTAHSEIALEDFEAPDGGTTTEQVLEVEIRATIPDEAGISATASGAGTVTVTNPTSTVKIGFSAADQSFTGADETLFMTDGVSAPAPVDVDVSAFNSATVTINGAGGADGAATGGSGGKITLDTDLSDIDTLRTWVGEGPDSVTSAFSSGGGWGRFDGGAGDNDSGAGGGSSHVSNAATVDEQSDTGVDDGIAIADAGGGGTNQGTSTLRTTAGGGGARGGAGVNNAEGAGTGGDGGEGGIVGTDDGDPGGQQEGTASPVTNVVTETGGGNSGHADITLELTIDAFSA